MSRVICRAAVVAMLLLAASTTRAAEVADLVGRPVVEVRLFRGGQEIRDPATLDLVETRTGQPLSMRQVRESLGHLLISLGEFADVSATADPAGVVLRYDLIPLQAAVDVEVRGSLGRSRQALLDLIARRFGRTVRPDQIPDAVTFLEELYRESGRYAARITPDTGPAANRLVFEVDQGPAARIRRIDLRGAPDDGRDGVLARLGLAVGAVYDPVEVDTRLAEFEADVRARRYYEARFRHDVTPSPDG